MRETTEDLGEMTHVYLSLITGEPGHIIHRMRERELHSS